MYQEGRNNDSLDQDLNICFKNFQLGVLLIWLFCVSD